MCSYWQNKKDNEEPVLVPNGTEITNHNEEDGGYDEEENQSEATDEPR